MKGQYAPRYGLSSEEVMIMKAKFQKVRKGGATDWENLDQFCRWAVEEGYKPGMRLRKHDSFMPHSVENSYFAYREEPEKQKPGSRERHATFIDSESPFCRECSHNGSEVPCTGCAGWEEYYVQNWNENISRFGKAAARPVGEVWGYEHPDLVREGIAFEHS
jgi:hypothetical protein